MSLERIIATAMLVPMGDPNDPNCKQGMPLMLWGDPGIGKSERVESASTMVGLPVQTVYAATSQPEDVSGAAFQTRDDKIKVHPLLPGIQRLIEEMHGVLFLDELSCARPAVQAAYLGVVLTRRVGDVQLPPGIRIIAAANPPDTAAGGWELEPPMANRFCHIDVKKPTAEEWGNWLLSESSPQLEPIDNGQERVKAHWDSEWSRVKGSLRSFMQIKGKTLLHKIPEEGHKDRGRSWPSHRQWSWAGRALATCRCLGESDSFAAVFVEGCVGDGAATEFMTWLHKLDIPKPEDMLRDGWSPDKARLDRTIAAYNGMAAYVIGRPTKEAKIALGPAAWSLVQATLEAKLFDITLPIAKALVENGLDTRSDPAVHDVAKPVLVALAKAGYGKFLSDPSVR